MKTHKEFKKFKELDNKIGYGSRFQGDHRQQRRLKQKERDFLERINYEF
jgi:hypothetical protein